MSPIRIETLAHLVKYNYLAVHLFFMISGFVILMTAQSNDIIKFIKSRAVRLYPALWICCTLTFLTISHFMVGKIATSWPRYFANLTMLNGFVGIGGIDGPYWSLYVEIKFYLLVALLIVSRNIQRMELFLAGWLLIAILNYQHPISVVEYVFLPEYASYFIAGCSAFLMRQKGIGLLNSTLFVCSFFAGLMYDADFMLEESLHYQFEFSIAVLIAALLSFYAMFIFMISTDGSWIKESWVKFLEMGGSVSYPLYLLHMGIGMSFINVIYPYFPPLVVLGLTVVCILLLSWGVHRFGERPLANWLRTRLNNLEQRHAVALQRWRP